jgi:L-ascorbate metabolism protein UlaG (beta-lactamase superfamily)
MKVFGKAPSGERFEKIKRSPQYKNGRFHNRSHTPTFADGHSIYTALHERLFKRSVRHAPQGSVPSVKTDLHNLPPGRDKLVWFGHSSYLLQLNGIRILVDPVLSNHASPFPGMVKAFAGTDIYKAGDVPEIDYLFITHDHYDHLDYKTILQLKPKVRKVICPLGVGEHLQYWGYKGLDIIETDWYEAVGLAGGLKVKALPARHFSGRGFKRNNTLWCSFLLQTPSMKIFLGGDSGYDSHYREIGSKYGPVDIAIMENGQYNAAWRYIHHLPEDLIKAIQDLKAKKVLPVHSGKFSLSNHAWDEPLETLSQLIKQTDTRLLTPMIGQVVELNEENQQFSYWWREVK